MKKVLAIDMGATSIRGILGWVEDGKIHTEEVMRFSHDIVHENGRMRWQFEKILSNIKGCIEIYQDQICSIGIDTWGVDFGILDSDGKLIENPVSYRDTQIPIGYEAAKKVLSEKDIFLDTGTQLMSINTLFQLLAIKELDKATFDKIHTILMMPDLIQYFLTGKAQGEETIWSTSQILNLATRDYSAKIKNLLGLSDSVYPEVHKAGSITGYMGDIAVVNVCGHDTASAVLLTQAMYDQDTMFLSCGTWSLFGARVNKAMLTEEVYNADLTNELGYDSANLLFKNITGLYLLEKYKSQLEEKQGRKISFDEITEHCEKLFAESQTPMLAIDITDPCFANETMDAAKEIAGYLAQQGQTAPSDPMDYFAIIYDSLIDEYINTKSQLESIVGKQYHKLHMIGGGAKSRLLCSRIASRMNVELTAGPFEASALGNILIQLVAMNQFDSISSAIACAMNTEKTNKYHK